MAWNGSGVFSRLYNWVTDAANAINITDSRMDAEMDGFATGIQACVAKNGENTATADLPMGTYKHTNIGNASARNHYAAAGQIQDQGLIYAADTGAANAYVIAPTPAITAYAAGQRFVFIATNANTTSSTINISGLGVKSITKRGSTALDAGDIAANQIIAVMYDGTQFQIVDGLFTAALKTKLDGIATGATANSTDATLLARANHTGTQLMSTISNAGTLATQNGTFSGTHSGTSSGTNTGDQTNISGNAATATTAGTVTTAAQPNITSLGTLTVLQVDNININGAVISSNTGAISFDNENLTTTGSITGATITGTSDERFKENWRPVPPNFVEQLALMKSGIYDRTDIELTQAGIGAQSWQQLLPETVLTDEQGIFSIAYGNAALVSCVELAKEVMELKAIIRSLQ